MPIIYDPRPVTPDFEFLVTPIRIGTICILFVWVILNPLIFPPWSLQIITAAVVYNLIALVVARRVSYSKLDIISPFTHGLLCLIVLYYSGGIKSSLLWVFTLTLISHSLRLPSKKALIAGLIFVLLVIVISLVGGSKASFLEYTSFIFSNAAILGLTTSIVAVNSRHRTQLLSTLSHELRTPMTVIKGNVQITQMLLARGCNTEEVSRRLKVVDGEVDNLAVLLDKIQETLTTYETIEHEKTLINLNEVIGTRVTAYQASYTQEIKWEPWSEPLWILGTKHQIKAIIDNIIHNALVFSAPHGEIGVSLYKDKSSAHIVISDNGPGIPFEIVDKVTDGFYREKHRSEGIPGGLGLGLYSVKQLVARHGGETRIDSKKGKGVTVHILLPLVDHEQMWPSSTQGNKTLVG